VILLLMMRGRRRDRRTLSSVVDFVDGSTLCDGRKLRFPMVGAFAPGLGFTFL